MTVHNLNEYRHPTTKITFTEPEVVWMLALLEQQQVSNGKDFHPGSTALKLLMRFRSALRGTFNGDEAA